jgi:group I intron endonuclease
MEKTFNFVYITTNLVNGKQYVGDHTTTDINDTYLGSGKQLKYALKKYGQNNFKREILEYFNTKKEAFDAQEKYINEYNTLSPNGYNLSPRGGANCRGGLNENSIKQLKSSLSLSLKGKPHSKEWNKHVSESLKGKKLSEEHRKKLSIAHKNKPSPFKGKHHSEEFKKKISEAGKGRHHSENTKLKFKNRIPWNKGKRYTLKKTSLKNAEK